MPRATTEPRDLHTHARGREHGFTVVEIVVVLLIVGILMAVVVPRFLGAKGTTYAREAKAAGASYAQAIAQYQGDNYNTHPRLARSGRALQRGPVNLAGKPYMPAVPEAVQGGRVGVDLGANCTNAATVANAGSRYGQVSICFAMAPDYAVRVASRTDPSRPAWKVCWLGRTAKAPRC